MKPASLGSGIHRNDARDGILMVCPIPTTKDSDAIAMSSVPAGGVDTAGGTIEGWESRYDEDGRWESRNRNVPVGPQMDRFRLRKAYR